MIGTARLEDDADRCSFAALLAFVIEVANSPRPLAGGYRQRAIDLLIRHSLVEPQVKPQAKTAGYSPEAWRTGI